MPSRRRQTAPAIAARARVQGEAQLHRLRPRHEQLDGGCFQQILVILDSLRRHLEREDPVDVLSRRAQRLAAGRHHMRVWIGAQ
jgi:hypothetical protein